MLHDPRAFKLTYEDYLYLPEDGQRHEILDGEHAVSPAPTPRHQLVVFRLLLLLGNWIVGRRLGQLLPAPIDVVLSPSDVVQPDLVFVATERLHLIVETHLTGAPDLVVEVLSSSSRRRDLLTKRHLYQKHGVAEYWAVDPELETVTVYRLGEEGFLREAELALPEGRLESPLFPGLGIPLAEIFE